MDKRMKKRRIKNRRKTTRVLRQTDSARAVMKKKPASQQVLLNLLFYGLVSFMLVGGFIFMQSQQIDKTFFGYRFYDVLTNSMVRTRPEQRGNFQAGDLLLVKAVDPQKVEVGDIITFVPSMEAADIYLTHRVIKKLPNAEQPNMPNFITQGDANNQADPPINGRQVIGSVVFTLPRAGTIIQFIRENVLVVSIFLAASLLLFYFAKGYLAATRFKNNEEQQEERNL